MTLFETAKNAVLSAATSWQSSKSTLVDLAADSVPLDSDIVTTTDDNIETSGVTAAYEEEEDIIDENETKTEISQTTNSIPSVTSYVSQVASSYYDVASTVLSTFIPHTKQPDEILEIVEPSAGTLVDEEPETSRILPKVKI